MGIAIKSVTKECKSRFFNKDIPGYDLDEKRGQFADCCIFCQETPGCKAYAWSDYRGGTCWMKSTITEMVEKQGVQVGILDLDTTQQCKSQYLNKDIKGNDIKGIKGQFDECCYFCLKTNGCKAYSWVNEDGGSCWLKSVNGPLIEWGGLRVGVIEEPAKKKSKIEDQQIVPNQKAKQYLNTDYRLHLKFESKVADHCLKYALSDEKDIYMQMLCDPYADEDPHKLLCSRYDARKSLDEIFEEGRKSGKKINPNKASELMKKATLEDKITKRFRIEDRLNPRQIGSYFSRKAFQIRSSGSQRTKRSAKSIDIMDEMLRDEGDPTLSYKYEPMYQDEFEELRERLNYYTL
uniref:Apple domain-containing protein n=1 Tax=Acrobeloides nanus TaxID=290746 RepID=A0A914CWK2_9BILA